MFYLKHHRNNEKSINSHSLAAEVDALQMKRKYLKLSKQILMDFNSSVRRTHTHTKTVKGYQTPPPHRVKDEETHV